MNLLLFFLDGYGNNQWRHEKSSDPHKVYGTYGYKDKNGIMREVEYVADKHGFRAMIKTSEPGTAPKDPAYIKMNSNPIQIDYKPQKGNVKQKEQQMKYQKQQIDYNQGGPGSGVQEIPYDKTMDGYGSGYSDSSQNKRKVKATATVATYKDK